MKVLLDTCTLIWLAQEPEKLSTKAQEMIQDSANELFVSHVSVWEMSLKIESGKMVFPRPLRNWIQDQENIWGFSFLEISLEHILRNNELPKLHRDPFDRLLVSQSIVEIARIVTPDGWITKYPVDAVW